MCACIGTVIMYVLCKGHYPQYTSAPQATEHLCPSAVSACDKYASLHSRILLFTSCLDRFPKIIVNCIGNFKNRKVSCQFPWNKQCSSLPPHSQFSFLSPPLSLSHHKTDDVMWINNSVPTNTFRPVNVAFTLESVMVRSDVTSSCHGTHPPPPLIPSQNETCSRCRLQCVLFFSSLSSILFHYVLVIVIEITRCVTSSLYSRIEDLPVLLACWNELREGQSHPWITKIRYER